MQKFAEYTNIYTYNIFQMKYLFRYLKNESIFILLFQNVYDENLNSHKYKYLKENYICNNFTIQ